MSDEIKYSLIDDLPKIKKLKPLQDKADEVSDRFYHLLNDRSNKGVRGLPYDPFLEKLKLEKEAARYASNVAQTKEGLHDFGNGFQRFYTGTPPEDILPKIPKTNKLKLLGKALPVVGAGLSAYSALKSPDASSAVMDAVIPGGVESMGVSPEQMALDKEYKNPIRKRKYNSAISVKNLPRFKGNGDR